MDYDREFYPIYSVVMLFPVVNVTYFNVKMQKLSPVIPLLISQSDGVLIDENSVVIIKVCTCHKNSGNFKSIDWSSYLIYNENDWCGNKFVGNTVFRNAY